MPPINDDILFDEGEDDTKNSTSGISLDTEDTTTEETNTNVEDKASTESTEEDDKASQTDETKSESKEDEEEEEEIDLDTLFAELDDAKDVVDQISDNKDGDNTVEVSQLKTTLNNMEQIIKKLSNEKADLVYKNAELEAFGSDGTDPQVLLLSRNLSKSKDGDEKSKTKAISLLKNMLYDLTGEDYEQDKINKDIDLLTATEQYNSVTNPNLKTGKKVEDDGLSI